MPTRQPDGTPNSPEAEALGEKSKAERIGDERGTIRERTNETLMERPLSPKLIEEGIRLALDTIRGKYAELPLHNPHHTETIVSRITVILSRIQTEAETVSERQILLGKIAAAFHDIVRDFQPPENEEESAKLALAWMRSCNQQEPNTFTENDMQTVSDGIMATVPSFFTGKFEQPHLFSGAIKDPQALIVAVSIALADVVPSRADGFKSYREEGGKRFREWPAGKEIQAALAKASKRSDIDATAQTTFKKTMIDWLERQIVFADHLCKTYLGRALALVDDRTRTALQDHFGGLESVVMGAAQYATDSEDKGFWTLAEEMGFQMPEA